MTQAAKGAEALDKIAANDFDVVMTDLKLDEISGIDVLKAAKNANPRTEVIVLTGYGSVESAVEAMKSGAIDYLRIAHEFHTLIVDRIPVMDYPQRNEAKRFIALIDTLYDNAVKLVASAQAEPPALYLATDGYEANEFKRTASRLFEMRSNEYLALPHGHHVLGVSQSTAGCFEDCGCDSAACSFACA